MIGRQPFLDMIREHPADDGPRRVYADWLEENGEPERAEFIRVQVELANVNARMDAAKSKHYHGDTGGKGDPDCQRCQDLHADKSLRDRERDLLFQNSVFSSRECETPDGLLFLGRRWPRRIPLGSWIFRRGFVESVTLSWATFLDHEKAIRAAAPVTKATLTTWPDLAHPGYDPVGNKNLICLQGLESRTTLGRTPGQTYGHDDDLSTPVTGWTWAQFGWTEQTGYRDRVLSLLAAEWPGIEFTLPTARSVEAFRRSLVDIGRATFESTRLVAESMAGVMRGVTTAMQPAINALGEWAAQPEVQEMLEEINAELEEADR